MKRIITLILLLMTAIFLFGCTRVIETPADELTTAFWECKNSEGSVATLSFSGDIAAMTITDTSGEVTVIEGSYSVDKEKLYITSHKLFRTYEFSYSVFRDRVLITYGGITRTFEKKEIPANAQ
ncbi:MAG: hypothetical protein IJD19_04995 [Ruminococcus sp.]|nr:hypothetical protein [Ruminococcus sp.]